MTFNRHFQNEANALMTQLEEVCDEEINLTDSFRPCIANGLITIIRGCRYSYTDPEFVRLVELLRGADRVDLLALSTAISLKLPRLWAIIPHESPDLPEITAGLAKVIRKWIVERQESAEEYSPEILIDAFLKSEEYQHINSTGEC